jgi:hypothetical protein
MRLSKRDLFVIATALRYAQSNVDDVNSALEDDETEGVIILNSGDLFGTLLSDTEVEKLADKVVDFSSKL